MHVSHPDRRSYWRSPVLTIHNSNLSTTIRIRFPQGESGLDVYNRATSFIATMFRDFANENIARDDLNVIIVTHGLTLRLVSLLHRILGTRGTSRVPRSML